MLDGLKLPLMASSVTLTTSPLPSYFTTPWDMSWQNEIAQFPSDYNGDFAMIQSGEPKQDGYWQHEGQVGAPPIPPKTIHFTAVTMANLQDVIVQKLNTYTGFNLKPDITITAEKSDPTMRNFSLNTALASSGLLMWTMQSQQTYLSSGFIARSDLGFATVFASKALNVFVWDMNSLSPLPEQPEIIVYKLRNPYGWQRPTRPLLLRPCTRLLPPRLREYRYAVCRYQLTRNDISEVARKRSTAGEAVFSFADLSVDADGRQDFVIVVSHKGSLLVSIRQEYGLGQSVGNHYSFFSSSSNVCSTMMFYYDHDYSQVSTRPDSPEVSTRPDSPAESPSFQQC